jgi:hypothetical protein
MPPEHNQARDVQEAYWTLDPFALVKPGDPWYVDLGAMLPREHYSTAFLLKKQLAADSGGFKHVGIVGHRGVGKTTLVRGALAELRIRPIEINAIELLDRNDFVFSDVMLAVAEAVVRELAAMGTELDPARLDAVRRWFTEEIISETHANQLRANLDASVDARSSIPFLAAFAAKLVATLRTDNEYRTELRRRTRADPGELVRRVNLLLDEAHRAFEFAQAKLCIVIDGLEKFEATELVDRAMLARAPDIRNLHANVVIFFNPANQYSPHSISVSRAFDWVNMPVLPVRFTETDTRATVRPQATRAFEALLSRRMLLDGVFESPHECVERLAFWSGGHINDLLTIARHSLELLEPPAKVTLAHIDDAGRAFGMRLTTTMRPQDFPRAVAIYRENRVLDNEHDRRLLQNSCVLPYDGKVWWDIHPGIRADPLFEAALARIAP